jgi:HSP20 family protein
MWPLSRPVPGDQPVWVPNTNVFISAAGELVVQVELSSMRSENLEITVQERTLRIIGDRPNPAFEAAKTVLVHEMHCGPFESVLELPAEYDLSRAHASYFNGVLNIFVPKKGPPPLTSRETAPFNPS